MTVFISVVLHPLQQLTSTPDVWDSDQPLVGGSSNLGIHKIVLRSSVDEDYRQAGGDRIRCCAALFHCTKKPLPGLPCVAQITSGTSDVPTANGTLRDAQQAS